MNNNDLGYELDMDKVASILSSYNLVHLNKIEWEWNEDGIICQGLLPEDLMFSINHAVKS